MISMIINNEQKDIELDIVKNIMIKDFTKLYNKYKDTYPKMHPMYNKSTEVISKSKNLYKNEDKYFVLLNVDIPNKQLTEFIESIHFYKLDKITKYEQYLKLSNDNTHELSDREIFALLQQRKRALLELSDEQLTFFKELFHTGPNVQTNEDLIWIIKQKGFTIDRIESNKPLLMSERDLLVDYKDTSDIGIIDGIIAPELHKAIDDNDRLAALNSRICIIGANDVISNLGCYTKYFTIKNFFTTIYYDKIVNFFDKTDSKFEKLINIANKDYVKAEKDNYLKNMPEILQYSTDNNKLFIHYYTLRDLIFPIIFRTTCSLDELEHINYNVINIVGCIVYKLLCNNDTCFLYYFIVYDGNQYGLYSIYGIKAELRTQIYKQKKRLFYLESNWVIFLMLKNYNKVFVYKKILNVNPPLIDYYFSKYSPDEIKYVSGVQELILVTQLITDNPYEFSSKPFQDKDRKFFWQNCSKDKYLKYKLKYLDLKYNNK